MNKKLGLLLIISFLAAQAISLAHAAEHGVDPHEHHGQLCEIYLHAEQAKTLDTPATAALAAITSAEDNVAARKHAYALELTTTTPYHQNTVVLYS